MKTLKFIVIIGLSVAIYQPLSSQVVKSFSLKQAVEHAILNNNSMINAKIDVDIAKKRITETTAIGLPQISGSIQYQDFLNIPTSLLPDFISPSVYGVLLKEGLINQSQMPKAGDIQFFPVKFGTQHNATASVTLSQLIFSGQYIVGLQAARVFKQISEQALKKTEIELKYNLTETYCLTLSLMETNNILDSSLTHFRELLKETEASNKQGFVEETNVDQLRLNVSILENSINALNRQVRALTDLLKFQIGVNLYEPIILTDKLSDIVMDIDLNYLIDTIIKVENNIDYKILQNQVEISKLSLKREKSNYLPTLAGVFNYSQGAMRRDFDFFEGGKDWFPTTLIGLNLDIPLWSSWLRHSKVQQAQLTLTKAQNSKEYMAESIQLQFIQAKNEYLGAVDKFNTEKKNVDLANKILSRTIKKYKEGIATSMELTQAHTQFLNAQSNYFSASFELINSKNKIEKIQSLN